MTSVLDGTNQVTVKKLYENNILSTLNSLEIASHFKSNYIYISSSRVYNIDLLNNLKFYMNCDKNLVWYAPYLVGTYHVKI